MIINEIKEGEGVIINEVADIVSKKLPVFYNPVMKFNRDITCLLLEAIDKKNIQACDLLAGSGIRSIRFLKELPKDKIDHITINDKDDETYIRIKKNLNYNKITFEEWSREDLIEASIKRDGPGDRKEKNKTARPTIKLPKVMLTNLDANFLLTVSNGYDYIDIDPFGSPNPFLDLAVRRISRGGILAVTATDISGLAGSHPFACKRKYWAVPMNNERKHEIGLRILIRKCQLIGAQFEKALTPIMAYNKDHYYRIFFSVKKSKKAIDKLLFLHGVWDQEPTAGPLWLGRFADLNLLDKMMSIIESKIDSVDSDKTLIVESNVINFNMMKKEILFLQKIRFENSFEKIPYYYDINELKKSLNINVSKKLLRELLNDYSDTHHNSNAFKTTTSPDELKKLLLRNYK